MFEKLFKYPRVLTRHREGPGADARELFLTHRYNEGAARNTLTRTASELLLIAKYIDVTTDKPVSTDDLEVAAGRWVRHQQRRRNVHGSRWSRMLFLQIATPWLRFLGLLREPERVSLPFVDMISDFSDYMRGERGLSEVTIRNRCWHVGKFLSGLARKNRALGEVSVRDVDEFLASKGSNDWGRVSVATSSRVLRSFFRHAEIRGWCVSGIRDRQSVRHLQAIHRHAFLYRKAHPEIVLPSNHSDSGSFVRWGRVLRNSSNCRCNCSIGPGMGIELFAVQYQPTSTAD